MTIPTSMAVCAPTTSEPASRPTARPIQRLVQIIPATMAALPRRWVDTQRRRLRRAMRAQRVQTREGGMAPSSMSPVIHDHTLLQKLHG